MSICIMFEHLKQNITISIQNEFNKAQTQIYTLSNFASFPIEKKSLCKTLVILRKFYVFHLCSS